MEVNNYLSKIKAQIKKGEVDKALKGLILYAILIKNQSVLGKATTLSNRYKRLTELDSKGLVFPSSAVYLHNRIIDAARKLLKSVEIETTLIGQKGKNDLVLNISKNDIEDGMLSKLRMLFRKEFGQVFNVILK